MTEVQLQYIKENEEYCWEWLNNPSGYYLIFPVRVDYDDGLAFSHSSYSYQQHELTREDLKEYFKNKQFDKDMKGLLD